MIDCIRTESEDLEDEDEIRDLTAEHTLDHHDHRLEKRNVKIVASLRFNQPFESFIKEKKAPKKEDGVFQVHTHTGGDIS